MKRGLPTTTALFAKYLVDELRQPHPAVGGSGMISAGESADCVARALARTAAALADPKGHEDDLHEAWRLAGLQ